MSVLIIKNTTSEGPGTIKDHLREAPLTYFVRDLEAGELLPDLDDFSHLVIMGGPMAVYEMHRYPFLINEALLIDKAIKANKHILGICLGAQMLAHVLGARVYPGKQKEVGWYEVALTDEGMKDPCISQLVVDGRNAAQVFQWHGDTFDLPRGAVRLASSSLYPNQAFRFSNHVYALQFHIEVTPSIVREWLKNEKGTDQKKVSAESERIFSPYLTRANNFYRKFFNSPASAR
ncbi:MAG TPA: type 1 glutamine amidotransferase [Nitrospirota bacterium]|nr:type 1 glutamine amidotransferase [Nitrospirota bacterium]